MEWPILFSYPHSREILDFIGPEPPLIRAMKRIDLLRKIRRKASELEISITESEGGSHTKLTVGHTKLIIGRHRELKPGETRAILRILENEFGRGWWKSE